MFSRMRATQHQNKQIGNYSASFSKDVMLIKHKLGFVVAASRGRVAQSRCGGVENCRKKGWRCGGAVNGGEQ